jgi:uncharacterized protein (DUF2237 family)
MIVFKQPLALHSTKPMTGFMRNGYCEAPKADAGNHSIAGTLHTSKPALIYPEQSQYNHNYLPTFILTHINPGIVTNEFLDFSASRGNDLRQVGLTDGCKWCLCVNRWKEAFDARTGEGDKKVPKIVMKATNERALEGVKMEDLKKFAVDKE